MVLRGGLRFTALDPLRRTDPCVEVGALCSPKTTASDHPPLTLPSPQPRAARSLSQTELLTGLRPRSLSPRARERAWFRRSEATSIDRALARRTLARSHLARVGAISRFCHRDSPHDDVSPDAVSRFGLSPCVAAEDAHPVKDECSLRANARTGVDDDRLLQHDTMRGHTSVAFEPRASPRVSSRSRRRVVVSCEETRGCERPWCAS